MAGCRIVNGAVEGAVSDIAAKATEYNTAGADFITKFESAIADMEGDAKDALVEFMNANVKELVQTNIGEMVQGMSDLLETNRTNFVDVDKQIADSIRNA